MSLRPEHLSSLAALNLPGETLKEVLAILADSHEPSAAAKRQAKCRAKKTASPISESVTCDALEVVTCDAHVDGPRAHIRAPGLCGEEVRSNIPLEPSVLFPKIKTARRKARRPIASDEQPNEQDCAVAAHLPRETFRREWQQFRDHHIAKGSLMADWQAAWRTWVGNIGLFSRGPPTQDRKPSFAERMEAFVNRGSPNEQNGSGRPPIIDGNVFMLSGGR